MFSWLGHWLIWRIGEALKVAVVRVFYAPPSWAWGWCHVRQVYDRGWLDGCLTGALVATAAIFGLAYLLHKVAQLHRRFHEPPVR